MTQYILNNLLASRLESAPQRRPTFDESARRARNKLRPFSLRSIVRHALILLHRESSKPTLDEMKTWPWITLLIVKLALEDKSISMNEGAICTPRVLDECRQVIWDAQSSVERKEETVGGVYLMVRAMMRAQIPFQIPIAWEFIRWPALIARLDDAHPTKAHFINRLGIEPDVFLCLCYISYAMILKGSFTLSRKDFSAFQPYFGNQIDLYLNEFSRDLAGLREELRDIRDHQIKSGNKKKDYREMHEFPWLSKYPLLKINSDSFEVWHPAVFARGMEEGIHKRLSEQRGSYASPFSKVFEEYVLELIGESGISYLSESNYKDKLGGDKNAVEAIIVSEKDVVLIESKMTIHSEDVIGSNKSKIVWRGLKRVREAMQQAWLVSPYLENIRREFWKQNGSFNVFLIVVTSQPVFCATGEHFKRLFRHDIFDPQTLAARKVTAPTAEHLSRLPLENIIIASIDEFERLMLCVKDGSVHLTKFLRDFAVSNKTSETSVMFLEQSLPKDYDRRRLPSAIELARAKAEKTVLDILGHKPSSNA